MVTLQDVQDARGRIAPYLRHTPLMDSAWLRHETGADDVRLKLESLQVSNSFKIRGALNALSRLRAGRETSPRSIDVVTASAGNHGRAVAWAAERLGLRATVFTPRDAPSAKLGPIKSHGADLRAVATDYEDAERLAIAHAKTIGATFVSAYDDDDVIAGAGTVALEIAEDWPEVDVVLVPVGGGGLISGIAAAIRAIRAGTRVIGVEAEASPAFSAARKAGRLVTVDVHPTIADGLAGNADPETRTWTYIRDLVDDVVTVGEDDLRGALRGLVAHEHLIAEGAGIVGVAAVVAHRVDLRGARAAVVVTGANIDLARLVEVMGGN